MYCGSIPGRKFNYGLRISLGWIIIVWIWFWLLLWHANKNVDWKVKCLLLNLVCSLLHTAKLSNRYNTFQLSLLACQRNNCQTQIWTIITYHKEILTPQLYFHPQMKSQYVLVFHLSQIIIAKFWFQFWMFFVAISITIINLFWEAVFKFHQGEVW
jgi:hypothetical protein